MHASGRQDGFTLIELMLVIAIIAIIQAIAIPNLIEARKGSNEAAAIGAMRTISSAQSLFRDGDTDKNGAADYAVDLYHLGKFGLIPPSVANGAAPGYVIEMQTSVDRLSWTAIACPAAVNRSGRHCISTDPSNDIGYACPPGQRPDPVTGGCVSDETAIDFAGGQSIKQVDSMSGGRALPMAIGFVSSAQAVQQVLAMLDRDGDGALTFFEALDADRLFDIARELSHGSRFSGPPLGQDKLLRDMLQQYVMRVIRELALGIATENDLPAVQLSGMHGDPASFLAALGGRCSPTAPGC